MATPDQLTQATQRLLADPQFQRALQQWQALAQKEGGSGVGAQKSAPYLEMQRLTKQYLPAGTYLQTQPGKAPEVRNSGLPSWVYPLAIGAAVASGGAAAGAFAPAAATASSLPTLASTTYPSLATTAAGAGGSIAGGVGAAGGGGGLFSGLLWPSIISAGTNIAGGILGSRAAGQAADQQAAAAREAAALQYKSTQDTLAMMREQWGQQQENQRPWLETGKGALAKLSDLVGVTPQAVPQTAQSGPMSLGALAASPSMRSIPAGTSVQNSGIAGGGMDVQIGGPNPTQIPQPQTVMMMAPTGEQQAVPAHLVEGFRQKGARVIG